MPHETPKWTPGPWGQILHGDRDSRVGANTLLAIVYSTAFRDAENQKANAHLIAAAPELYAALEAMAEWAGGMDAGKLPPPWPEMVATARAALSKARGE